MDHSSYHRRVEALNGARPFALRVICALCAEIVAPFASALSDEARRTIAIDMTAACWASGQSQLGPANVVSDELPLNDVDDSYLRQYWSDRASSIVYEALRAQSSDVQESAVYCFRETLDLARDLDFVLQRDGRRSGPYASTDLTAKFDHFVTEALGILHGITTESHLDGLRQQARQIATSFCEAIPSLAEALGWQDTN